MILFPNKQMAEPFAESSGIFPIADPPVFSDKRVLSVVPGSAAAAAGVRAGDVLVTIDGRLADELSIPEVRQSWMGGDHEVVLVVRRGRRERTIKMTLKPGV